MTPEGRSGQAANITRVLRMVSMGLDLDVAFAAHFTDEERVVDHVFVADGATTTLAEGHRDPREETFCQRIVDGRVDPVIADARLHPHLSELSVTGALGIGAYIGTPIVRSDTTVHGTLCAFGPEGRDDLGERDLQFLRVAARLVAELVELDLAAVESSPIDATVLDRVVHGDPPRIVFQQVVDVASGVPVGYEALSRFDIEPDCPPDEWYAAASRYGVGVDLELRAVAAALEAARSLPAGRFVACNVSAAALQAPELVELVTRADRPVVLELTAHEDIVDYGVVDAACIDLRALGVRIAVDDSGSDLPGLSALGDFRPDVVKLDRRVVSGIDRDPTRRGLAGAVIRFAGELRTDLIAEGVETTDELDVLVDLGVTIAQGYLYGVPTDASQLGWP